MLNHRIYIAICLSIITAVVEPALAQTDVVISIRDLDDIEELAENRGERFLQDRTGFVWLFTPEGIARFDGYSVKWVDVERTGILFSSTLGIPAAEDSDGYIWGAYKEGIVCINPITLKAERLEARVDDVPFDNEEVETIRGNNQQQIIVQTTQNKYYHYQGQSKGFVALDFLEGQRTVNLFPDRNAVWFTNQEKVKKYDLNGKEIETIPRLDGQVSYYPNTVLGEDVFFKLTPTNLQVTTFKDGQFTTKANLPFINGDQDYWQFIYLSHLDQYLLYPLLVYDGKGNALPYYLLNLKDGGSLEPLPLEVEYRQFLGLDQNGQIWVSRIDGISILDLQPALFKTFSGVKDCRGIWADDNFVVVGTTVRVDHLFDRKTRKKLDKVYPHFFSVNATNFEYPWLGAGGTGIVKYDPSTKKMLARIPCEASLSDIGLSWACLNDSDNNWWVAIIGPQKRAEWGFYNANTMDSIRIFDRFNSFDTLRGSQVFQFLEDGPYVWASTDKGLVRIDKQKGVVQHLWEGADVDSAIPLVGAHFLHKDEQGVYWVASISKGLVRFELSVDNKVRNIRQYTTADFLSSDLLYTLFEDNNNRLWISTFSGINCFDKKTEKVTVYTKKDGLPVNEFNRIAGFQDKNGHIFFGGVEDLVTFNPDEVSTGLYEIPLLLSSVDVYIGETEQKEDYYFKTQKSQSISISSDVRYFEIMVALADYVNANKISYFYQIEGIHEDWRPMSGNRVQLSNLPYGSHQLVFKALGPNQQFSSQELRLSLQVERPYYLTWWFILIVVSGVLFSFWMFLRWQLKRFKQRQVELENLVQQRTEKINQDKQLIEKQAERLKALDETKSRFFANISHELRTPLTLIKGPLTTVLKSKNLTNKEFTSLQVIKRHTNYLHKRINEILELNRLELNKGQINLIPVSLYDFVKVTISNFESVAPQKNITFSFDFQIDKKLQVLLDKNKFEHVIFNYLSNAFKYTTSNGHIAVVVREVNNKLQFLVRDTGVGIPEKDLPNVFQRFYQAENAQKTGSTGIGLALCQEIAKLLDGRVWAESKIGKGSTFYFEIPYSEILGVVEGIRSDSELREEEMELSLVAGSEVARKQGQQVARILLVEDNPALRDYIESILIEYYQVDQVENGQLALDYLAVNTPNLIISDIMMPVMDGLEFLERVKRSDQYRHLPMIMLTARVGLETKLSALQLGVDDYVTKPFDEKELLVRVRNLLENQKERMVFVQTEDVKEGKTTPKEEVVLSESDQKWLADLEEEVMRNLGNSQYTMQDCADALSLSERQLRRRVKKCSGMNFNKYLRFARLKLAKTILENGEKETLAEVAYTVGFETPAYFSKLFVEAYGKKPSSYI